MSDPIPVSSIRELTRNIGNKVVLSGWLDNKRSSGKIAFLQVRCAGGTVQAVAGRKDVSDEDWAEIEKVTQESTIRVTGTVKEDKRSPIGVEIQMESFEILSLTQDYPITPKEHGTAFLMEHRHLWLRSKRQVAIARVRHEVVQAVRDFFDQNGFYLVDTPILSGSIGESAGTLFETEYFDLGKAYLAQTGQLYLEAACAALGKVYCFGPTFRAEKSKTRRHLTEFWMVEPEVAFNDSAANMKLQEEFVSYVVARVLDKRKTELKELERDTKALESVAAPFHRISYTDAVTKLQQKGSAIVWGKDLGAEDEQLLTEGLDRPLFVMNYPKEAKAFYMKENPDDPRTVLCDDCLAPGLGEIIGGSQREDDFEKLKSRIEHEGLPVEQYQWYLDLRKYGTFVHAGFGLGIERTVQWITGSPHIREMIAFPRMLYRLYP
ncbi:MAG TPA: asparagine--tRNA ligase [Candidatus Polarisedimenticolia bacterium]|nr:asparagine--tRNA ligase [Candidatus Polarisedimenticolia bacterium]